MPSRLAASVCAAFPALLLTGCGEAIGDPPAPDATEREVLADAAEMLPGPSAAPDGEAGDEAAPLRGDNAPE
ncbi:hypothetical protein [Croceicoccus marinus]|jgi:hypothetical protein|uniref:Argininosuccinate lyase n=1 Tax=Croceicoccus marinus TaxID=450378 RepID=A0A7G6VVK4_9SPHN|nr:hypothetical protein [Croceicoccus marinus]QNE05769.1 hypothetical protein H4O24_03585 [Croceicoccus marinus]